MGLESLLAGSRRVFGGAVGKAEWRRRRSAGHTYKKSTCSPEALINICPFPQESLSPSTQRDFLPVLLPPSALIIMITQRIRRRRWWRRKRSWRRRRGKVYKSQVNSPTCVSAWLPSVHLATLCHVMNYYTIGCPLSVSFILTFQPFSSLSVRGFDTIAIVIYECITFNCFNKVE